MPIIGSSLLKYLRFRQQRINHWPNDEPLTGMPEPPNGAGRACGVLGPFKAAPCRASHLGMDEAPATECSDRTGHSDVCGAAWTRLLWRPSGDVRDEPRHEGGEAFQGSF